MNKHEATLYFAKELNKNGHVKLIYSPLIQSRLERIAISFELTDEHDSSIFSNMWASRAGSEVILNFPKTKDDEGTPRFCEGQNNPRIPSNVSPYSSRDYVLLAKDLLRTLTEKDLISQTKEANYIFIEESTENVIMGNQELFTYFSGVPLAIITDREVSILKELYKGDLSSEVREVAQVLGIGEELEIDYKILVESDPERFCEYFEAVSDKKRRGILEGIWTLIDKNKLDGRIQSLLRDDKYKDLALDVGRSKLKNG